MNIQKNINQILGSPAITGAIHKQLKEEEQSNKTVLLNKQQDLLDTEAKQIEEKGQILQNEGAIKENQRIVDTEQSTIDKTERLDDLKKKYEDKNYKFTPEEQESLRKMYDDLEDQISKEDKKKLKLDLTGRPTSGVTLSLAEKMRKNAIYARDEAQKKIELMNELNTNYNARVELLKKHQEEIKEDLKKYGVDDNKKGGK